MTDLVTVYKRKANGHESRRFEAEVLASPRPGWIATFSDAARHASYKQGERIEQPRHRYVIYLLATSEMLTASFYFDPSRQLLDAQCDIALPATRDGDAIVFVDLELDLVIRGDGSHYLRDFREFAEHRVTMNYRDETVANARHALLDALRRFRHGHFPFDGTATKLLEERVSGE